MMAAYRKWNRSQPSYLCKSRDANACDADGELPAYVHDQRTALVLSFVLLLLMDAAAAAAADVGDDDGSDGKCNAFEMDPAAECPAEAFSCSDLHATSGNFKFEAGYVDNHVTKS